MSIVHTLRQKSKQFLAFIDRSDIYIALIIVLIGIIGFGLGRLSAQENQQAPITIHDAFPPMSASAGVGFSGVGTDQLQTQTASPKGVVVASKNSTKYHLPWCSGAQRIKGENKIWFASQEEARAAGYTPAANCKGL